MDDNFIKLLEIFSYAAFLEGQCTIEKDVSKMLLLKNAYKQNIEMFLFETYPCDEYKDYIKKGIVNVVSKIRNVSSVDDILKEFENIGIKYCVLKGEALSHLYKKPLLRFSKDFDILVSDESAAISILKKFGFVINNRSEKSHHTVCVKNNIVIEIHHKLYGEFASDIWFKFDLELLEAYRTVENCNGNAIYTLGITDGLLYLLFHTIKHFIIAGVSIRNIMDLLLYIREYKELVDWQKVKQILDCNGFNKIYESFIGIGIEFMGFNFKDLPKVSYDKNLAIMVLEDIELGGEFGWYDSSRANFDKVYTKHVYVKNKHKSYSDFKKERKKLNIIRNIFPDSNVLTSKYSYANKNILFYFVACLIRLICLLKNKKKIKTILNKYDDNENITSERVELFKQLNMID